DGTYHWQECLLCGEYANYEEHTLENVYTEPNCVDTGLAGVYCPICGYAKLEVLDTIEHVYSGEGVISEAPTCETEGLRTWICDNCHQATKTETIAPLGHDFISDDSVYGSNEVYHWKICGRLGCEATSEPEEHELQNGAYQRPNCTYEGYQEKFCECGYTDKETLAIDSNYHVAGDEVVRIEPTCTEDGSESFTCIYCDTAVDGQVIEALGHDLYYTSLGECGHQQVCARCEYKGEIESHLYTSENSELVSKKTCTQDGVTNYYCVICNYKYESVEQASGHNFVYDPESSFESTCTVPGQEVLVCTECGAENVTYLPLADHNYTQYQNDNEKHWLVCSVCGDIDLTSYKAHEYPDDSGTPGKEASCTEDGTTIYTCVCGKVNETVTTEALGHQMSEWIVKEQATCGTSGLMYRYCLRCNEAYEAQVIPATGLHTPELKYDSNEHWYECSVCSQEIENSRETHSGTTTTVPSSCTEQGYSKTICDTCGYTMNEETYELLDHEWEETERVESTCYSLGYIQYKCKNCEATKTENLTEYAEHSPTDSYLIDETNGTHYKECTVCNNRLDEEKHTLTASYDGKWIESCGVCEYTNDISLDQKYVIVGDFEGNEWTRCPDDDNLILSYSSSYSNTMHWKRTISLRDYNHEPYNASFRICKYDENAYSNWVTIADYTNLDSSCYDQVLGDHYDGYENYDHSIELLWNATYDIKLDCTGNTPVLYVTYVSGSYTPDPTSGYAIFGTFEQDNYEWDPYPSADSVYYLDDSETNTWTVSITAGEDNNGYSGFRIIKYGDATTTVIDARNLTSDSVGVIGETSGDYNILTYAGITYTLEIDISTYNPTIKVTTDDLIDTGDPSLTLVFTFKYQGEAQTSSYGDVYIAGSPWNPGDEEWELHKLTKVDDTYQITLDDGLDVGTYSYKAVLVYSDHDPNWDHELFSENQTFTIHGNELNEAHISVDILSPMDSILPDPDKARSNVTLRVKPIYYNTTQYLDDGFKAIITGTIPGLSESWAPTGEIIMEQNSDGYLEYTFEDGFIPDSSYEFKLILTHVSNPTVLNWNYQFSEENCTFTVSSDLQDGETIELNYYCSYSVYDLTSSMKNNSMMALVGTYEDDSWDPTTSVASHLLYCDYDDPSTMYWEVELTLTEIDSYCGFRIVYWGDWYVALNASNVRNCPEGVTLENSGDYNICLTPGVSYKVVIDWTARDMGSGPGYIDIYLA
ncbi:MAG: hypothetical protein LUD22_03020, partial [Coprobacillus sp.]|nr:hypothetical protein [Coprobacillus sp.]